MWQTRWTQAVHQGWVIWRVNLIAHCLTSWNNILPGDDARYNLKVTSAGVKVNTYHVRTEVDITHSEFTSDFYKVISASPDRCWPTMANSGDLGLSSVLFVSREKSFTQTQTSCLLLAFLFLSGLAKFVSLNVPFKIFLQYDNWSWLVLKCGTTGRTGQKTRKQIKMAWIYMLYSERNLICEFLQFCLINVFVAGSIIS